MKCRRMVSRASSSLWQLLHRRESLIRLSILRKKRVVSGGRILIAASRKLEKSRPFFLHHHSAWVASTIYLACRIRNDENAKHARHTKHRKIEHASSTCAIVQNLEVTHRDSHASSDKYEPHSRRLATAIPDIDVKESGCLERGVVVRTAPPDGRLRDVSSTRTNLDAITLSH